MALDANRTLATVDRLKERIGAAGSPALLNKVLERCQRKLGAYHPATLGTQIELAEALIQQKMVQPATEHLVCVKRSLDDAFYPEHSLWIALYSSFSLLYAQQRLGEEANAFMEKASQLAEQTAKNVSVNLKLQHKLATCFMEQGNAQDADRVLSEVLDLLNNQDVPIQTLELLRSLALQRIAEFDTLKATQLLSRVVDESLRNHEVPAQFVVHSALRLADLYLEMNSLEQAVSCLQPIVLSPAIQDPSCAIEGLQIVKTFIELGIELDRLGDVLDCAELNLEVYASKPEVYPQEDVIPMLRMAGEVSYIAGEFDLARQFLSKALSILSEETKKDDPLVADILHDMAIAAFASGESTEALSLCHVALNTRTKVFGESDRSTLESRLALGMILKECGQKEKALAHLQACADLATKSDHKRSNQIVQMCNQILDDLAPPAPEPTSVHEVDSGPISFPGIQTQVAASIEANQKVTALFSNAMLKMGNQDYPTAVRLLDKALEVLESKFGSDHPDLIPLLQNLAGAHEALKHSREAEKIRARITTLENRA
jgi:tetratricopeptide (TPR) repeat protein